MRTVFLCNNSCVAQTPCKQNNHKCNKTAFSKTHIVVQNTALLAFMEKTLDKIAYFSRPAKKTGNDLRNHLTNS